MQSHLTKRVIRAIVNNEPLRFSQCRSRPLHTNALPRRRRAYVSPHLHTQRRTLFAFTSSSAITDKPTTLPSEAGLKPMRDLMRAHSDRSRPPLNLVLAKAFREFFAARVETPGVITGFQARLLINTWKHLKAQQEQLDPDEWQTVFSVETLEQVISVLGEAQSLPEATAVVERLARFAFLEMCVDYGAGPDEVSRHSLLAYINLLCAKGSNPEEAAHLVDKFWHKLNRAEPSPWLTVIKGFAIRGDARRMEEIAEDREMKGTRFDRDSHAELVEVLIRENVMSAVKIIYEAPIFRRQEPTLATKLAVIKFAVLQSETNWATPIYESLPSTPSAETRDIHLLWSAAHGARAADIADKVESWSAHDPGMKSPLSIAAVNNLIEFANSVKNPSLADEFAALAQKWELERNLTTQLLLLESSTQAADTDRVIACLQQIDDLHSAALEHVPLMNKVITILSSSAAAQDSIFEQISLVLDPLFENNIRLDASTLAALTHLLLRRHDFEAVSDLLRPRLGDYESEDRTLIRNALTTFILSSDQPTPSIWEAYGLLQIAFPETGVSTRTEIMTSFFRRSRADLACLVFGHMRQASDLSQRPKPDTYARCFQGIAQTKDSNGLKLVHNMLKLDLEVQLNTRMLNGLMLAYAVCDEDANRSMAIFRDILRSDEGPSHKTIAIFFKVCEVHANGAQEAVKMMQKVKKLGIEVDRKIYTAYIEALAAQCEFELATKAVEDMQEEFGFAVTRNTIGLFYNAIPYEHWKDRVEKWAREKYPEQWMQLERIPRTDHEEGLKFDGIVNEILV